MAQVTLYLSESVVREARRRAHRANKSLSSYVSELLNNEVSPRLWPADFVSLLGEGKGDLEEPSDPPPEDVEPL